MGQNPLTVEPPAFKINPAFHRWPKEAAIVGRLLAAFGELEYQIALLASHAMTGTLQPYPPILRALYRLRSTSSRIDAADALARPAFARLKLVEDYSGMLVGVKRCLAIRNQFAHCNWADHERGGLFFVDLQDAAAKDDEWEHDWFHVDDSLLSQHELFFVETQSWIFYLDHEVLLRMETIKSHAFPRPPALTLPPLHNPRLQHQPPWLSGEFADRHEARARAAELGVPTPAPKQQAQDAARAAKRAKKQADRERDQAAAQSRKSDRE